MKVRIPGGAMAYAIPEHAKERARARRPPAAGDGRVRGGGRAQREPRGAAHAAGLARTWSAPRSTGPGSPDVLGTVAGDDTIILVCAEAVGGATVAAELGRARRPLRRSEEREERSMTKRVVLAYSGGLDTSVAVRWIREEWGAEVDRVRGRRRPAGRRPWDAIRERARSPRARSRSRSSTPAPSSPTTSSCHAIQANALYEGKYPLVSALSRPVIVEHLVRRGPRARRRRGRARLHRQGQRPGALRGVGRAPSRPTSTCSRRCGCGASPATTASSYAAKYDIPISVTKEKPVLDRREHVGPRDRVRRARGPVGRRRPTSRTRSPRNVADAPTRAARDRRRFEQGVPVALDGDGDAAARADRSSSATSVGAYGWGRLDMVENRRVGIKSREVYECPGVARAAARARGPRVDHARARPHAREGTARAASPSSSTTACGTRR